MYAGMDCDACIAGCSWQSVNETRGYGPLRCIESREGALAGQPGRITESL